MSFQFHSIIARLIIVIDIAPLMMLFCNCLLFCNCPFVDCNCLLLKYISFNTKCFYRWFLCSANFWDKSPLQYLEILKLPLFTRAISKFSKMHSGSLSKIALPNIWLLVEITVLIYRCFVLEHQMIWSTKF